METDPARAQSAAKTKADGVRLAREVIDIDKAILSLLILDKTGAVVAMERSSRLDKADYMNDKDLG